MPKRAYRFRLYPSKQQETEMRRHLFIAKNLWNELLAHSKQLCADYGMFPTRSALKLMVKNTGLFSQTAQEIAQRLERAVWRFVRLKRQHKKAGFPRFKPIDRMKSLHYPQFGFSLGNRLQVTPFGRIPIKAHRQIGGRIKTLTIRREASGKWFAIFCADAEARTGRANTGPAVGIDLGLVNFAALSDGTEIKNPRHFAKWEKKLAFVQRRLSRKNKGSQNREKAKNRAARVFESISNARGDFLHKTANSLLSSYSLIAMESLQPQEMSSHGHGKGINDAAWKKFANILCYKAESAGCRVEFVNPRDTTKECSNCGELVEKALWDRHHNCPNCGLSIGRDLNAARNILKRATAGTAGSNACGDGKVFSSLKQDATGFSPR